jgi:hypothetical protein
LKGKANRTAKAPISTYIRADGHCGRIFMDTTGPFKVPAKGGKRYMIGFVDDFSGEKHVYFLKRKTMSEVKMALQRFKNEVVLPAKSTLGIVRSDNGTEYFNREVIYTTDDPDMET